jgi:hypothetical protein
MVKNEGQVALKMGNSAAIGPRATRGFAPPGREWGWGVTLLLLSTLVLLWIETEAGASPY